MEQPDASSELRGDGEVNQPDKMDQQNQQNQQQQSEVDHLQHPIAEQENGERSAGRNSTDAVDESQLDDDDDDDENMKKSTHAVSLDEGDGSLFQERGDEAEKLEGKEEGREESKEEEKEDLDEAKDDKDEVSPEEEKDELREDDVAMESGRLFSDGSDNQEPMDDQKSDTSEEFQRQSVIGSPTIKPSISIQSKQQITTPRRTNTVEGRMGSEDSEMRSIWARPRIENNRNFYPAKVPNSLHIEMSPFSESVERTMKSNTQLDVDHTIRYRLKIDEKSGAVLTDENGFPMHESNTKLVQWSDGSWTLAIGSTQYECVFQNDKSIILDETNRDLLISQGVSTRKITLRPLSSTGGHLVAAAVSRPRDGALGTRPKTTQLTTTADALKAETTNRRRMDDQKDIRASRARQRSGQMRLDARFLEEDTQRRK